MNEQPYFLSELYVSSIQKDILNPENMRLAFDKTRIGKSKFKNAASKFNEDSVTNLELLVSELIDGEYTPLPYTKFTLFDPKERIVHAPRYKDKIVQHAINNVLAPIFAKLFIPDSYACVVGKGNSRAVKQLQHYLKLGSSEYGTGYYLVKADIQKFFYTIDRSILETILGQFIYCPWTYALLCRIIDSSPGELGLPLGNLTSQLFANLYLNQLDQYVKRTLQVKYYIRYADDIFCVLPTKLRATEVLNGISNFVSTKLNLKLHPLKSSVLKPVNGLDALGFKIFPNEIRLKHASKERIRQRLKHIECPVTIDDAVRQIEQSLNGWVNHAKISTNWAFIESLVEKYEYISLDSKTRFHLSVPQ